jgi:hypothetical protein
MELVQSKQSFIQSEGVGAATVFTIEASPHAFRMLSSGAYSDKKAAVLREVGCNAADAHVAAGKKDLPFEVKLPTILDSEFWIQDWGPGLDEAEVRKLYTTYFKSTKQSSNDFTGAFGLGSKSPFSYTDSFSVIACKGGVQRTFVAHLDKTGSPVIRKLSEQPVSKLWKSGVRVGFPVKRADFDEFRDKAIQVFQWFNPRPDVKGLLDNWAPQPEYWLDGVRVALASSGGMNQKAIVLMGNVAYPLDFATLFPESERTTQHHRYGAVQVARSAEDELSRHAIILKVPIGTVQVALSREGLQYDDGTRAALKQALSEAVEEIYAHATQRLYDVWEAHTGWARNVARAEEIRRFPRFMTQNRAGELSKRLTARGVPSDYANFERTAGDELARKYLPYWVTTSKDSGLTVKVLKIRNGKLKASIVHDGEYKRGADVMQASLKYLPGTKIYIGDVDLAEVRVMHAHREADGLIVTQRGKNKAEAERVARRISDEMGGVPLVFASSLPDVQPKDSSVGRSKVDLLDFATSNNPTRQSDGWIRNPTEVALDDVPEDCRYFLVRDGAPASTKTVHPVTSLDEQGNLQWHGDASWEDLRGLLTVGPHVLRQLGVDSTLPKGFILVPPTAVARLELLERGFSPVLGEFRRVAQSAEFVKAMKCSGIGGMPFNRQYGERPAVAFANRFLCHDTLVEAMRSVLYPEVIALLSKIQKKNFSDEARSRRTELESALGSMWRFLGIDNDVFMSWEQVADTMDELYPALPIVALEKMQYGALDEIVPALKAIFAKQIKPAAVKLAA